MYSSVSSSFRPLIITILLGVISSFQLSYNNVKHLPSHSLLQEKYRQQYPSHYMQGEDEDQYYPGNFFDDIMDYTMDDDDEDELPINLDDEYEEFVPKINSVTLVGRVGQNPEPRYFNDNKVVLRMSLAVKRKYHPLERQVKKIQSGEEETDWFNLELWGRDAEYAGKYVTKGARIGVTGSLNVDTWVDKVTGEERSSPKIVVQHLDILESRAEAELRMGNTGKGNYGGSNNQGGGNFDYGDGPSSAGSGGFFDN